MQSPVQDCASRMLRWKHSVRTMLRPAVMKCDNLPSPCTVSVETNCERNIDTMFRKNGRALLFDDEHTVQHSCDVDMKNHIQKETRGHAVRKNEKRLCFNQQHEVRYSRMSRQLSACLMVFTSDGGQPTSGLPASPPVVSLQYRPCYPLGRNVHSQSPASMPACVSQSRQVGPSNYCPQDGRRAN